ncbi:MAG: hypothetical protein QM484_06045 [Woeseiaceae bacterium]
MLNIKVKGGHKFKSVGKCDLLRKRLCDESMEAPLNKISTKEYMDEIFAGLMWLG